MLATRWDDTLPLFEKTAAPLEDTILISSILNMRNDQKGVSKLVDLLASNVLANAVLFGGVYLLTRLVSPAEFGKYSLLVAITLALQPLFTLRYEHAIPVASSNRAAASLFIFCVFFTLFVTGAGFALSVALISTGALASNQDGQLSGLILLMWPACLALALYSTAQATALRAGTLRQLAVSRVARALLVVVGQLSLVFALSSSASSLIAGELVATIIASAIIIGFSYNRFGRRLISLNNVKLRYLSVVAALKQFRVFALVGLPHAFAHSAFTALFGILLGAFYGPLALGQYFLMRRMIFGVTVLFSTATYQLSVSEASAAKGNPDKLRQLYKSAVGVISIVTIPAALLMVALGEPIFSTLFGSEWGAAGQLATATFLLIAVEPIASAIAFVPVFLKRQNEAFGWSVAQNLAGIASLSGIFAFGGSLTVAILGSSLIVGLVLIAYMARLFHLCKDAAGGVAEATRLRR